MIFRAEPKYRKSSRVVIFDPNWNVSWDLQAQDRAYRIGQTKFTRIYRMITAGGIEDITYTRQIYKQQLSNIGLYGMNERRYFTGVAGVKGEEGEIFGLANLFQLNENTVLTNDIIERTEKRELKYKIAKSNLQQDKPPSSDLFSLLLEPLNNSTDTSLVKDNENESEGELSITHGVLSHHKNTDVIGQSEVESELATGLNQDKKSLSPETYRSLEEFRNRVYGDKKKRKTKKEKKRKRK